jgi:hypothetical protein
MPYREINYKRRRTFNELGIFRAYGGGNVLVELCVPHVNVLPMWCTEYVGSIIEELFDVIKNYYNIYLK